MFVGASFTSIGWFFGDYQGTGGKELIFGFTPLGGSTQDIGAVTTGANLVINVWYHAAVDKDSTGKIRLYLNGVPLGSYTAANSAFQYDTTTNQLQIGSAGVFGGSRMNGWLDELRISKGDAVYLRTDRNRTFRNTGGKRAEWLAVRTPALP